MKMKQVALISCVSKKLEHAAPARDIYQSPLFKKNMEYCQLKKFDKIYILSAKHHLLELDTVIEPYNETLNTKKSAAIKEWADKVFEQLKEKEDISNTEFTFLAGNNYRKFLINRLPNYRVPMFGMPIGKQLQWLTKNIKEMKTQNGGN
jgi:hypothetical protein